MVTLIHWPLTIGLVIITWLSLILVSKYVSSVKWPRSLRPVDVTVFVIWWSLASITFQLTHYSILLPLLLMYVIWGLVIIGLQTFVGQNFEPRRFLLIWWRLVDLTSLLIWLCIIVYVCYFK